MFEPEPAVVRAAAAGDLDAFDALVRGCQADLWRFLRHLVGDDAAAEDIAQETFIRVFQRIRSFRFQSKFSTWVLSISRNAAVDFMRARTRRLRLEAAAPAQGRAADAATRVELQAALSSLPSKLREALLAVEVVGMTYREAGTVLGVPEGTVKSRVFQARHRLVAWFSEDVAGEV